MGDKITKSPHIRLAGFTDAWEPRKLGEVAEIIGGGTPNTSISEYWDGDIDWYTPAEIADQIYVKSSQRKITEQGFNNSSAKVLPAGTVLFTSRAGIGKTAILANKGCTNQGFQSIVPHNDELDSYFIFSRTEELKRYGETIGAGSTFVEVSGKQMANMDLMMPKTMAEQQVIGAYFRNLDNLITLHQLKLELLKVTKKSMLQKMFPKDGESVPEIRFAGFTDAWEQRELGKMGDTFTGLSGKTKEDFGHGDAKFVTYINVFGNVISDPKGVESIEIDNKQNQVKYGDVFFTTSSETPEEVGMASVWLENTENVYLNSFCFGYRPTVEFDVYYLAFMLRSPEIRKKFMFLAQGISRYNISKNKVMEMNVPVPELNEQRKVGTFFRNLDDLITLHQRELDLLKDLKKSMLKQMFI
ncbi:restriction endonuclease subunit S [Clostridium nigeriense]|uniref:restriction endonuclease subunit S n=1 Tax=Clostridium nigeriense TaxID=1805470 RepID=UPI003D3448CE